MITPTPRFTLRSATVALAIATLLATGGIPDVQAQQHMSKREKMEALRAKQRGEAASQEQKVEDLYPQATREQPEARPTRAGAKALQEVQEAFQNGEYDKAIALANAVVSDADSNTYDKSFAYLLAGNSASADGDDAAALGYFSKALETGGLDNNNHYTAMYNLAAVQYGLDRFQPALATLDRYLAETGKDDQVEAMNLRGALLMDLERYEEAARLYAEQMQKHPENTSLLLNAVAAYQQAGKDAEAAELLAAAAAKGSLNDATGYRALYVSYINADRDDEAEKLIRDGLAKGVLQPGPQLARDYMVLGQKAYFADDTTRAIEMYKQAAGMAEDGEAALNLAKIYYELGRDAESKTAARQALEKGVKKPEEARKLLGGG